MTSKHYVLTLNGSAQQLSSVLGGDADDAKAAIWIQPRGTNVNLIYVGTSNSVTSTNYGIRLEVPVSGVPQAPFNFGEFAGNLELFRSPLKMSQFWVFGTNGEFLHILTINYGT